MSRSHKRPRSPAQSAARNPVAGGGVVAQEACCGPAAVRDGESPARDQVAARAHEIWELRGRPRGQDLDIWLAAEAELRSRAG